MVEIGYTAMCEQTPVRQLVALEVGAERQRDFLSWAGTTLLPELKSLN